MAGGMVGGRARTRGAHGGRRAHSQAAAALTTRPRENLGIAALAVAYSRDLDQARTLNKQGLVGAVSPTMLAWGAYVAGEIESLAGDSEPAEHHCKHRVIGEPSRDARATTGSSRRA